MLRRLHIGILGVLLLGGWGLEPLHADKGQDAWLRYASLEGAARAQYESLPANLVVLEDSPLLKSAQGEMIRGFKSMTGKTLLAGKSVQERAIVLGTLAAIHAAAPGLALPSALEADGFWLITAQVRGFDCLVVTSPTERGVLYGVFAFLNKVARGEPVSPLHELQQPYA